MRAACLILLALAGCSGEPATANAPEARPVSPARVADRETPGGGAAPVAATPTAPVAPTEQDARRCLPLVAADCGCVWGCAIGTPTAGGGYLVQEPRIAPDGVKAVIQPWCVQGECTDAFHGEIICSGICAPKPADASCHFDSAGACVGEAAG